MERAVVVRGKLSDSRHVELEEAVTEIEGSVEVVLRPLRPRADGDEEDIFDFIAELPPGNRSKDDIDRQIHEERDSWGNR